MAATPSNTKTLPKDKQPQISGVNTASRPTNPNTETAPSAHRHRISLEDDHEIYLQLMAGENKEVTEKTAVQLQLEERARLRDLRARDPAVTDPQCAPGPVDFECVERGERRFKGTSVGGEVGKGNAKKAKGTR